MVFISPRKLSLIFPFIAQYFGFSKKPRPECLDSCNQIYARLRRALTSMSQSNSSGVADEETQTLRGGIKPWMCENNVWFSFSPREPFPFFFRSLQSTSFFFCFFFLNTQAQMPAWILAIKYPQGCGTHVPDTSQSLQTSKPTVFLGPKTPSSLNSNINSNSISISHPRYPQQRLSHNSSLPSPVS